MDKKKISTRGRKFTGNVIADRMPLTVTVEWDRRKYLPKFERYAKRRTRVKAHNPPEINAKVGQVVRIAETRKLSKTKNFIVVEVLGEARDATKIKAEAKKDEKSPNAAKKATKSSKSKKGDKE